MNQTSKKKKGDRLNKGPMAYSLCLANNHPLPWVRLLLSFQSPLCPPSKQQSLEGNRTLAFSWTTCWMRLLRTRPPKRTNGHPCGQPPVWGEPVRVNQRGRKANVSNRCSSMVQTWGTWHLARTWGDNLSRSFPDCTRPSGENPQFFHSIPF